MRIYSPFSQEIDLAAKQFLCKSSHRPITSRRLRPDSASTSKSMSLSSVASPRATDPNTRTLRIPREAANRKISCRFSESNRLTVMAFQHSFLAFIILNVAGNGNSKTHGFEDARVCYNRRTPEDIHLQKYLAGALLTFMTAGLAQAQVSFEPVTLEASPEAPALLRAVSRLYGPNAGPYADFFPGRRYCDILATDVYGEFKRSYHDDLAGLGEGIPIALGEVGGVPTPAVLKEQGKWTWFMVWADLLRASKPEMVRELFNDPKTLSRGDPLPGKE